MLPSLSRFLCIFAVLSGLLSGCTTTPATPDHIEAPPDEIASVLDQGLVPVARYGRYTLIELVPQPAQRDLLRQAVEITIPPTLNATVGDAMRHVLLRSGYRLCDGTEAAVLYALPLPAAHLHLGPLLLRDALLVLAGPAWALSVDDRTREVCFNRSADAAEVQS
ncbi:PilL N-terminal domain-containing protein [Pseudomonas aeruginosa]|uniref:PFGI-1 class ICE element type IV pilus protein PilL2 n=1 Tax=Pseudomonas aeruginosa TaxID=287 RepID=UPI0028FDD33F|nr:PilL N-terminal domain-containing protein [Pseudomonas aeruginosa]MDU0574622.1 PilL N-terminal domain-containing protein [Pseudomonas aeruginosa]MDU0652983.1 PilL N-terminal domain-containing protein [Pseudomonas aeruginosa]MDX4042325.1 PilL N-terminal domain-containing protein [Pseudomonas aeruginosa]